MKKKKNDLETINLWLLYSISIICGAILMALEIIGGRLLSPFFGSSVYVWGSIISVFLIALSAGYYLGGNIADRKPKLVTLIFFIGVSGLLILLIPLLLELCVGLSHQLGLGNFGALFVALLLFFLPSLGLGMVSPYVVKLGLKELQNAGNLVGRFYAVSTFGSIVGTLATTFILIPLFGVREIIFALGITLLVLAAVVLVSNRLFLQSLALITLGTLVFLASLNFAPKVTNLYPNEKLLYYKESMYNNISVIDSPNGNRYLVFNDTSQSVMDRDDPNKNVWDYTRLMEAAMNHYQPDARTALLIGLGGGSIPKSVLAKKKNMTIDAVDIDPEVISVARKYFKMPKSNAGLNLAATDGRMYLKDKKGQYDVIMIDAYNRDSIPYHLTTKEFFGEMAEALKPKGIAIFNLVSTIEGESSPFLKSILRTSDEVFANRRLFSAEDDDPFKPDNRILIVSRSKLDSPGEIAGYKEYKSPIDLNQAVVLTDNYAPAENLAARLMMELNKE